MIRAGRAQCPVNGTGMREPKLMSPRKVGTIRRTGAFALFATLLAALVLALAPPRSLAQSGDEEAQILEPAPLTLANRHIFTMRSAGVASSPAMRARTVEENLIAIVRRGGPLEVTTQTLPEGVAVAVDHMLVFRVLKDDVDPEVGEDVQLLADAAVHNLRIALGEMHELRDSRRLLTAAGYTLLATLVFAGLMWGLWRGYAALARRVRAHAARRAEQLSTGWSRHLAGRVGVNDLVTVPLRVLAWLVTLLLAYEWLTLVLGFFPYTRPWSERLLGRLLDALGRFGSGMLEAIPGLVFVMLIFFVTRFLVRVMRVFFEGVAAGRVEVGWVDEATARPTERLLTAIIWLFALVAAYPYLPGSGSEAFKGIGVFVGLMLSIGASGIVNQAVSGLMLMYTRALRPGEFVQIGDTEGTVTSVGFLNTQIETLRHELINIPNAVIASSVTRNYSRLARDGGVRVASKVTIGYDTPWRQVQAMLLMAADRTEGLAREPAPRVLQTALQDFYVEYTLLVTVQDPSKKYLALSELNANIQDAFNEHGVQIMSPNYEADPEAPKIVPKEKWFEPPAAR
jgi:small-conductance mechanosensitive channel